MNRSIALFFLLIISVQSQLYPTLLPTDNIKDEFQIEFIDLFDHTTLVRDTQKSYFNLSLKASELVNKMGMGYDLSNTLDAHISKDTQNDQGLSSETCWGNPYTTEEMIDSYVTKGFKSLRIPVTWHNHIIDNSYTIDPK
jgi:endoglucanase